LSVLLDRENVVPAHGKTGRDELLASTMSTIHYRRATPGDVLGMSDMRKRFIDESMGSRRSCEPEYYRWKLFDNPSGPGVAYVAEADGLIVGMISVSSRPMRILKTTVLAGELGDGFVHPDYQRRGIFQILLIKVLQDADQMGFTFTYGTPTDQAFSVEKKVGYSVAKNAMFRLFVRPVSLARYCDTRQSGRFFRRMGIVGQELFDRLLIENRGLPSTQAENCSLHADLFERVYSRSAREIHADVSEEYLSWRYDRNPDSYETHIISDERLGEGYFILKVGKTRGYRTGYIVDYGYSGAPSLLRKIFTSALLRMKELEVDLAACWAGTVSGDILALMSCGLLPAKSHYLIVRPGRNSPENLSCLTWRFCIGDSDNI
jgi:GNAT superfamily N-acetyltransferase